MQSTRFDEMQLSKEMQKAVADMGFEELTPIQSAVDPPHHGGKRRDRSGTNGHRQDPCLRPSHPRSLSPKGRDLEAVILCPTRELAMQVAEELQRLAKYRKDAHIVPVYGGQPIQKQLTSLKRGARIIVGTPGASWTICRGARCDSMRSAWWCSTKPIRCSTWASWMT